VIRLVHRELTEKDLSIDEKKVLGKIIDLWSLGRPEDPYAHSTERQVMKYSEKEGLSKDKISKVLNDLESYGLIHRSEEGGEIRIKYRVEAAHLVKELQKTAYVNSSMEKFTPPHH
jgi:hypothetical protein